MLFNLLLGDFMKVKLIVDELEVDIGYSVLDSIVGYLPDDSSLEQMYEKLASHPSSNVRRVVADKESINKNTLDILAADVSVDVLRNLVRNSTARNELSYSQVASIIEKDVECADSIASYVDGWDNSLDIAELLLEHTDPQVRYSLANNSGTPRSILKKLLKDNDKSIASAAKESLR